MNAVILHESSGRIRLRLNQKKLTLQQADMLEIWFQKQHWVRHVTVHDRTQCIILYYKGNRQQVLNSIKNFSWDIAKQNITLPTHSTRQLNREFEEKLVAKIVSKIASTLFLPKPLRIAKIIYTAVPFVFKGICCLIKGKMKVELLDSISIGISIATKDFSTAGTVMFLLQIGELLEEWTRKKSVEDLAQCMSLNVDRVWLDTPNGEILTPISQIQIGDRIIVRVGGIIPIDAEIVHGEVMVNQASLTGESVPIPKHKNSTVYAGTIVEEGECILEVKQISGQSRYDQIVKMLEQSEQMKCVAENKATNLADKLVPYTFAGSLLSYIFTRNLTRALSVLMVDFSCALKLAMPLTVISAMREAGKEHITVKGGRFLEIISKADTIVFDKTGTLTNACPKVECVIPFNNQNENEMLRLAACLEEHFPHSMANAVVEEAKNRGLSHEEVHSKIEYIVAHGIASMVNNERVLIGSAHFVFEDEGCVIPEGEQERFDSLPSEYSHLYLAVAGKLNAVICISDPLRQEAHTVLYALRKLGFEKTVMLTGDSRRTAAAIAKQVGVDYFRAEVLPEDKAKYIAELRKSGHTVIMVGDGINDSLALSEADVGIAINDGAAIAQEIADITIAAESLWELVRIKEISMALMRRIKTNYGFVLGFNGTLIALGVAGIISPATSATLHNLSTLGVSLHSMSNLPNSKSEQISNNNM